jgi:hypothetical protein
MLPLQGDLEIRARGKVKIMVMLPVAASAAWGVSKSIDAFWSSNSGILADSYFPFRSFSYCAELEEPFVLPDDS